VGPLPNTLQTRIFLPPRIIQQLGFVGLPSPSGGCDAFWARALTPIQLRSSPSSLP